MNRVRRPFLIGLLLTAAICSARILHADTAPPATSKIKAELANVQKALAGSPDSLFQKDELNVGTFGSYRHTETSLDRAFKHNQRGGDFGGGLEAQYWVKRNFGVQSDLVIPKADDLSGSLFKYTSISFLARLPIGPVSIQGGGGLGHDFDNAPFEWNTHVLAGVEWRLNNRVGLEAETRYVFENRGRPDFGLFKIGMRFLF